MSATEPIAQVGSPDGADLTDGTPRELVPSAEELVSRGQSDAVDATPQPTDDPSDVRRKAAALVDALAAQTTAAELGVRAELPNGDDRAAHVDCDAERAAVDSRRVSRGMAADESSGSVPRIIRRASSAAPTTAARHSRSRFGRTARSKDIVVRRSSGDKALDQAALKILRLAAPFDPLPPNVRKNYDVLRFAYDWDFFDSARKSAAQAKPEERN